MKTFILLENSFRSLCDSRGILNFIFSRRSRVRVVRHDKTSFNLNVSRFILL